MKRPIAILLLVAALFASLVGCDPSGLATPTPLAPTPEPTALPTDTPLAEPSPTPTSTAEPTATATPVPVLTPTATTEPTNTSTPEPIFTPTQVTEVVRTPAPTREPAAPRPTEDTGPLPTVTTVVSDDPPSGGWSQVVSVPPGNRRVAITFDAGAAGEPMPSILAALRERGLRITMFFTGKFAEQYSEGVKQAAADGHEIANHTYSHKDSRELTDEELAAELARTEQILFELTGRSSKPYWRPPFGAYNARVLNAAADQGYRSIYWTLDSLDSVGQPKTPDFIFNRVTNPPGDMNLDGSIVLMHFGSQASADALPGILDRLAEMGLQVVTISELISP